MRTVSKLIIFCVLPLCALLVSFLFSTADSLRLHDFLIHSRLWAAALHAHYLTPPLLFLILNLLLGALFLSHSAFSSSGPATPDHLAAAPHAPKSLQPSISAVDAARSTIDPLPRTTSGTRLSPPIAPPKQKNLVRSTSNRAPQPTMAPSTNNTSPGIATTNTSAAAHADSQVDPPKKKMKKKKGSTASRGLDQTEEARSEDMSLKKDSASSEATLEGSNGDDEVDRRAEDFITKFYLQMKMQRLESIQRYNQRMDRSYGR